MKRQARLQSARAWLEQYQGEKVAAAYRKRYGVDWACTFKELEMLGVELDPEYGPYARSGWLTKSPLM